MTIYEEPFGRFRPFGICFDEAFRQLDKLHATATGNYPPYNLIKVSDDTFKIEIAAAGFKKEEFDVELKESQLRILAKQQPSENDEAVEYMHKGIAARNFERVFALAEHVEVTDVLYADGILSIKLIKEVPEKDKPRKFDVK